MSLGGQVRERGRSQGCVDSGKAFGFYSYCSGSKKKVIKWGSDMGLVQCSKSVWLLCRKRLSGAKGESRCFHQESITTVSASTDEGSGGGTIQIAC